MFLFGGFGEGGLIKNDVYTFDLHSSTWELQRPDGIKPKPRAGHTSVLFNNMMFVFGGRGKSCVKFNDVWVLDTALLAWSNVKSH